MNKGLLFLAIIAVHFQHSVIAIDDDAQKNNFCLSEESCSFNNDQLHEEYSDKSDNCDIDEYDQHICDDVQPPKISAMRALFTEWLGALLVRYITLREMAPLYVKKIKDTINKWLTW